VNRSKRSVNSTKVVKKSLKKGISTELLNILTELLNILTNCSKIKLAIR